MSRDLFAAPKIVKLPEEVQLELSNKFFVSVSSVNVTRRTVLTRGALSFSRDKFGPGSRTVFDELMAKAEGMAEGGEAQ